MRSVGKHMPRPTTGDEIREAFLRFFEVRDHLRHAPAALIPAGDPTLLLTNSGMAQFKAYFSGEAEPPSPRITTVQKCFRTTDIEEVGDATHLTLFEMLGNFSFGDYFKQESCEWALEFMTGVLEFPEERLYITIHDTDDEAEEIWLKLGIPADRISRFGDDENWWGPAGDEGPCGPCSELHYYRGDMARVPCPGDPRPDGWGPNLHEDFTELFNLVFTQYYHHTDGTRTELPRKNIDTGLGLERTAVALQDVSSVYETDVLRPLVQKAEELSGKRWGEDTQTDSALAVVAEHSRSAAFLIADGVTPENTGRGYVLRRLIRRCVRFGRQIELEGPFMGDIAGVAVELMGHAYPELPEQAAFVSRVLELEETQFAATVDQGTRKLTSIIDERESATAAIPKLKITGFQWDAPDLTEDVRAAESLVESTDTASWNDTGDLFVREMQSLASASDTTSETMQTWWDAKTSSDWKLSITGYEAFYLSDTYGFPIEVTEEIAGEHGMTVDRDGFEREMERQRQRARASAQFGGDAAIVRAFDEMGIQATAFVGYDSLEADTIVVGLVRDGRPVQEAAEGDTIDLLLEATPFYAEAGGQVGDRGLIESEEVSVKIGDTRSPAQGITVHHGHVRQGRVAVGDAVSARVNTAVRERIRGNHTATHLLHAALRQVLGSHVRQHGSLVAPDRLRFDFTHVSAVTRDELFAIQRLVNEKIRQNLPVRHTETTHREAIDAGALAFFGDRYGDTVRALRIGDGETFSHELCGGTHCGSTGEIGSLFIVSESSVGAGLRRIEAVTGTGAEELAAERFGVLDSLSARLHSPVETLDDRVDSLLHELDSARRRLADLERQALFGGGAVRSSAATALLDSLSEELERRGHTEERSIVVERDAPVGRDGTLRADLVARSEDQSPAVAYVIREEAAVEQLRELGDRYRNSMEAMAILLAQPVGAEERPAVIVMLTPDLVEMGLDASRIARSIGQSMGGGGGGRADVGQAGGRDSSRLAEALSSAVDIVAESGEGVQQG